MNKGLLWLGRITAVLPFVLIVAMLIYIFTENLAVQTEPPSPQWSRALVMNKTEHAGATVPVILPDGTLMAATSRENALVITRAKDGKVVSGTVTLPAVQPYGLSAVLTDRAEFFWLEDGQLRHAALNADGTVAVQPETVTTGVKEASPVRLGNTPTVFVATASGVTAWTRQSEGWRVGATVGGQAMDQVSARAAGNTAYVTFIPAQGEMRQLQLASYQDGRFQQPRALDSVEIRPGKDSIESLELAMDKEWAYALYVKNMVTKEGAVKEPRLVSAKLAGGDPLPSVELKGGSAGAGRFAGPPSAPFALASQQDSTQVVWVSSISEAFRRAVAPVVATLKDGKLAEQALAYKGYAGYRPAIAGHGTDQFITFAVLVGSGWEIQAASTDAAWKTALNVRQGDDTSVAVGTTLLTTGQMFMPFVVGVTVFVCIFLVLLMAYFFALSWMERNGKTVFAIGLILTLVSLFITVRGILAQSGETLPGWLATGSVPYLISLGLAVLVLPSPVIKMIRTKYHNPLGTIAVWGLLSLMMISLLFGPFMAHG